MDPSVNQERLAEIARVRRTYVSHLELGKGSPTLDTIVRIATALDLDPSDLVRGLWA
jgi:transcriptional regulator with XRE-family HTH domain